MMYLWSGTNSHCFTVKEVSWWASLIDVRTHVLKGIRQLFYSSKIPWNVRDKVRTLSVSYEKDSARKQKKFWIQLNTGFKWGRILYTTQAPPPDT